MTIFHPHTERKRVYLAHVQAVNVSPEALFEMMCPARRYEWDSHWSCDLINTDSGLAEQNCVYQVTEDNPDQGTWVVSRYDRNERISLIRTNKDSLTEINWSVFSNPAGGATVHVELTDTALSDAGDEIIVASTEESFVRHVKEITEKIETCVNSGKTLAYAPNRNNDGTFEGVEKFKRVKVTARTTVTPPPEAIFPMFSPVREYEWEPKWACKYHYNHSRDMEQGEIHLVDDPDWADYGVWTTARYDRPHRLVHIRTNDDRVTIYDWTYTRTPDGGTEMIWHLTDTGLKDAIVPHIAILTDHHLQQVWEKVGHQFAHYIHTGEPLEINDENYVGMPILDEETGKPMLFEKLKALYIAKLEAEAAAAAAAEEG